MKRGIKDLKEDKKLLDKLATLKNKEAISDELRNNNFDICDEELDELLTFLNKVKINELSNDDLENVTGGVAPAANNGTNDNFVFDLFQGSGVTPGTQCETEIGTNFDILSGNSDFVIKK